MLSAKDIEIVKSTVPLLEKHGKEITSRFYQVMFANHPELLDIFNHANQKQGRQQTALANAVYAAAAHIDRLETILPVVKQIAHKHRSLGIQPEHYPIVGKHLLIAIKDVLGDTATDEVIEAWGRAYQVIADAFIQTEAEMYRQAEEQTGGWKGFRRFIVRSKVKESEVITSFYLVPEDGGPLALYQPGQYISVRLDIPGEKNIHIRQYSLSDSPGKSYYRISVKKEEGNETKPEGIVSNYLHRSVHEGNVLELSAPAGDFVLDTSHHLPIVLLSGGVGLTPLTSMLNWLAEHEPNRPVTYLHAALNGKVHALKDHVLDLTNRYENIRSFFCYQSPTEEDKEKGDYDKEGYLDLPYLQSVLKSPEADFYFCGPIPFMKAMYRALTEWGVPEERIHFEFFGPAGVLKEEAAVR
jgi:nitric oxide dioxygenase